MTPGKLETQRCGSPGYVAPEVLSGNGYDTKADIFSAGVIFYILLSGVSPFQANAYEEVLYKNKLGKIEFPRTDWENISPEAIDLVKKMTNLNPEARITAAEALVHKWFSISGARTKVLSSALENMKKYNGKENENRFNVERIKPEFSSVNTSFTTAMQLATNLGTASNTSTGEPSPMTRRPDRRTAEGLPLKAKTALKRLTNTIYQSRPVSQATTPLASVQPLPRVSIPQAKLVPLQEDATTASKEEDEADFKDSDINEGPKCGGSELPDCKETKKNEEKNGRGKLSITLYGCGSSMKQLLPPTPGPGPKKTLRSINLISNNQKLVRKPNTLDSRAIEEAATPKKYFNIVRGSQKQKQECPSPGFPAEETMEERKAFTKTKIDSQASKIDEGCCNFTNAVYKTALSRPMPPKHSKSYRIPHNFVDLKGKTTVLQGNS